VLNRSFSSKCITLICAIRLRRPNRPNARLVGSSKQKAQNSTLPCDGLRAHQATIDRNVRKDNGFPVYASVARTVQCATVTSDYGVVGIKEVDVVYVARIVAALKLDRQGCSTRTSFVPPSDRRLN